LKITSISNQLHGIIEDIDISCIIPSEKPLRFSEAEEVDELATSIYEKGLLNPIIVRMRNELYEIVAGNRRFLACKLLGCRKIACQIVELDDKNAFEISLMENIQRKTLNPTEEAQAFAKYVSTTGWGGATELSNKIGKSISYITKKIRLLELAPEVMDSIGSRLSTSAAEELLVVKDKSKQSELFKLAAEKNLNVRQTRYLLNEYETKSHSIDRLCDYTSLLDKKKDKYNFSSVIAINKSISILRVALIKLGNVLSDLDDEYLSQNSDHGRVGNKTKNWMTYEILFYHKQVLNDQVNRLIKEKHKEEKASL
jgi:ParB family chromosome partitioning protein